MVTYKVVLQARPFLYYTAPITFSSVMGRKGLETWEDNFM